MKKSASRFRCPACRGLTTPVIRTATSAIDGFLIRRRVCADCDHRWYTGQEPEYLLPADAIHWTSDGFPLLKATTDTTPIKP